MSINGIGTSPYAALGYETRKANQTAPTNNMVKNKFFTSEFVHSPKHRNVTESMMGKAVQDMMQMQYDAGNVQGYLDYKKFLDAIEDDRKERADRKEQIDKADKEEAENDQKAEESKTDSEIVVKPDGSQVLVTTTTIGETQVSMSLEIAKPTKK